jgi:hypothetical protein
MYYLQYFYTRQGIYINNVLPVLGNTVELFFAAKRQPHINPLIQKRQERKEPIIGLFFNTQLFLIIRDPEVVEHLYVTKDIIGKDDFMRDLLAPMIGGGLFFVPTDEVWKSKRKSISSGLYKGKLNNFLAQARPLVLEQLRRIS